MNRNELQALIERYINTQIHTKGERELVQKLFLEASPTSFITLWMEYDGDYNTAVRESVKSSTSDKQKTIDRYKKLIDYLKRNTTEEIEVEWPPIDVSSRLDRLIYIMRILQTYPQDAAQFLSDKLWMSTRTVERELSSIQYDDVTDPVSFLDQSFVINGITRSNGTVHFLSSVHPMLLMENLTSVVVMIQALLEKAVKPAYKDWAMITAGHAWNQLTDYAKERVEKVTRETYREGSPELALFEELKTMPVEGRFRTERETFQNVMNTTFYCFKADLLCRYFCQEEDGSLSEHVGHPFDIGTKDETVGIRRPDGKKEFVNIRRIIRCEAVED